MVSGKVPEEVYDVKDLPSSSDPFVVFKAWLKEAKERKVIRPKTMSLATCSKDGKPSLRIVSMEEVDDTGILFLSFANSKKGKEIEENSYVAASFYWAVPFDRQVRIEGNVEKLAREIAEPYFYSHPREIQILLAASPNQSRVIESRSVLEEERARLREEHKDPSSVIPCPEHWAGYKIIPSSFEFFQGHSRSDKLDLSDRFLFSKQNDGSWKVDRLAS